MWNVNDVLKATKLGWWLRLKFFWYKRVRRLDIVGFYKRVPIIRTDYLHGSDDEERA